MPIYTVRATSFPSKSEAFEKRGLSRNSAAKISELSLMSASPTPIENVIRFNNVASELAARHAGHVAFYQDRPRGILRQFSGESPFESPTLIVEMKTGGEALNALGMFEVATSKLGLLGGQPTVAQFKSICEMGIDFFQTIPAGNVNIAGYIAFIQAWRGIRAFFALGGGNPDDVSVKVHISEEGGRKMMGRESVPAVVNEKGELVKDGVAGKTPGGSLSVGSGQVRFLTGSKIEMEGIPTISASDAAPGPGLLFPYFREMLESDPDYAYQVFASLFAYCLEDESNLSAEALQVHRRGFRYLSNSHAGRIIQHIYLGIRLSISTASRLVLIRDGADYAGFTLLGENFRIAYMNRVLAPLTSEELSTEIAALNYHHAAVLKVYEMLREIERIDGRDEEIEFEQVKRNPRMLRKMIMARRAEDIETIRSELSAEVTSMKFTQTYWAINPENLVRFMNALRFNTNIDDEPMYLHMEVLCSRSSEILHYLSVFGPQAPSIYHGTKSLPIARPTFDDPNLVQDGKSRAVPHIPFYNKGIIAAGADWATTYRNKAFRFFPAEEKYGGRGFSLAKKRDGFVANPHFDGFYDSLRNWVYREREDRVVVRKRKSTGPGESDDEEMDGGKAKKLKFTFV